LTQACIQYTKLAGSDYSAHPARAAEVRRKRRPYRQ